MIKFTLPEGQHTWFESVEDGRTQVVQVRDGDTADEAVMVHPKADYFVSAGMAERVSEFE